MYIYIYIYVGAFYNWNRALRPIILGVQEGTPQNSIGNQLGPTLPSHEPP